MVMCKTGSKFTSRDNGLVRSYACYKYYCDRCKGYGYVRDGKKSVTYTCHCECHGLTKVEV